MLPLSIDSFVVKLISEYIQCDQILKLRNMKSDLYHFSKSFMYIIKKSLESKFFDRNFVFDKLISPNCSTNLMIHFRNFDGYLVTNRANGMLPSSMFHTCTVF